MGFFECGFHLVIRTVLTLLAAYGLVVLLGISDPIVKGIGLLVLSFFFGIIELLLIV